MLARADYDAAYFQGRADPGGGHPAGYSAYGRTRHIDGEGRDLWRRRADELIASAAMTNKSVLEIGCAYGFLVADLVDAGVDAYGIDWSAHAIAVAQLARPDLADRFILADALSDAPGDLGQFRRNAFDWLISRDVLVCWPLATLAAAAPEWSRIARNQLHITKYEADPAVWYYPHGLAELQSLAWPTGSRLVDLADDSVTVL